MKKTSLLLILFLGILFSSYCSAATTKTISYTATVGIPFVIDPEADYGLNSSFWSRSEAADMSGFLSVNDNYIYTTSNFTYTVTTYNVSAQTYTITPLKTGTSTFRVTFRYVRGNSQSELLQVVYTIIAVDVTNVSIPNINMKVGEQKTYTPIITNTAATTFFSWQSTNVDVVEVSAEGTVTAVGVGTATILCTAHNGVTGQSLVTVEPIYIESITMNQYEAAMVVGEKLNLTTTVTPLNATDKSVTWSSTNEAVAVVDESGQVTAVGSGTCQIKATANDGSGKTASCLVTVEKNNKLTVTDMTQCSGGQGVLNVLLSDEETVMGFQFDLELPTGVTVSEKDGKLLAALTGNAVNTHSIASSKIGDGLYRFIVTPQGSRAISNANGDGMTITVDVADDVPTGTYDMTIKDIEMTVKHTGNVFEDIHPKDSKATLTVTEAVMGDVNGDGRVSVTDVISMNSYILEEEPAQFIRKVADMNGDGKVTITDMVQVIDIILGR